jgi:acetolactate synthase I/II/III large subunit
MNINEYLVGILERLGVDHVFGGAGQVNGSLMIALEKSSRIRTIVTKNEQAASFMACGYSMFSDRLGVCFATGGPGAFNVMSGLAVALSDSLPVLAVTGYEAGELLGKGALAETSGLNRTPDSRAMFKATTKKTYLIENAGQTCDVFEDAINTAFEGRPGPVHVHVPIDLTTAEVTNYREIAIDVRPVTPRPEKLSAYADVLARALEAGERVMLLVGYGAIRSHAQAELLTLVERYQIPFATTMDGKGVLPETHPLSLGVYGTVGDDAAIEEFDHADLVVAVGNSFAHNATYRFARELFHGKRLMHINIDKNEINKVYEADYPLISDARLALAGLLERLDGRAQPAGPRTVPTGKWHDTPFQHTGSRIHPAELVKRMSRSLPADSIVLGDAGAHMLWLSAYLKLGAGQVYQNPGSFGPMAAHVNGAIGAKCAHPDCTVVSACGDGGYLMGGFELMTAVQYDIPVVWVIFNNGEFNSIKFFLTNIFGEAPFMQFRNPDYAAYAKACGATGYRVESADEFERVFCEALRLNKPVLIDAMVESDVAAPYRMAGI